jgi:hypothetical protein
MPFVGILGSLASALGHTPAHRSRHLTVTVTYRQRKSDMNKVYSFWTPKSQR